MKRLTQGQKDSIQALLEDGYTLRWIAGAVGCSPGSVAYYKYGRAKKKATPGQAEQTTALAISPTARARKTWLRWLLGLFGKKNG